MLLLNRAGTWKFELVYVNLRNIYVIIFQKINIWMRQSEIFELRFVSSIKDYHFAVVQRKKVLTSVCYSSSYSRLIGALLMSRNDYKFYKFYKF